MSKALCGFAPEAIVSGAGNVQSMVNLYCDRSRRVADSCDERNCCRYHGDQRYL
ncbi:hypothetical protein OH492_19240 [Vibrio chagasii]|nr:hypothetical protein [Vibrio chagasii]